MSCNVLNLQLRNQFIEHVPELRRGRSYPDGRGNFVVEGLRKSDDVTDRISHRNGKYINNIFVPDSLQGKLKPA
jgi:hypothetical protein